MLLGENDRNRHLWLYDTFAGMTEPMLLNRIDHTGRIGVKPAELPLP